MSTETVLTILIAGFCIGVGVVWTLALCKAASKHTPEDRCE